MLQRQTFAKQPPATGTPPPRVQAGPYASGPMGSAFGQNGVGPSQVALATDGISNIQKMSSSMINIREPCELNDLVLAFHLCVSFSLSELSELPVHNWHTRLNVHLGSMVKNAIRDNKISANTPVKSIRVSVTNDSMVPFACDVNLYCLGYDSGVHKFGAEDRALHNHYFMDGGSATGICPPHKSVSFDAIQPMEAMDNFPVRSGFYQLSRSRQAKTIGQVFQIRSNSPLAAYIHDSMLWYLMDDRNMKEIPNAEDRSFWGEYQRRVDSILTPNSQEAAYTISSENLFAYSNQLIELRTKSILAQDLLLTTEKNPETKKPYITKTPNVPFGLTLRFFPVNLSTQPADNIQDTAASSVLNNFNDWILAAAVGNNQSAIQVVRDAKQIVSSIVTITFAAQPRKVMESDCKNFPPVETFQ